MLTHSLSMLIPERRTCRLGLLLASTLAAAATMFPQGAAAETQRFSIDLVALQHYLATDPILTALPTPTALGVEQVVAFEDQEYFAYVCGTSRLAKRQGADATAPAAPAFLRRVVYFRPQLIVIDDQEDAAIADKVMEPTGDKMLWNENGLHFRSQLLMPPTARAHRRTDIRPSEWKHSLRVISFAQDQESPLPTASVERQNDTLCLKLVDDSSDGAGRIFRLWLPDGPDAGQIEIADSSGKPLLRRRLFPAGILPPDLDAAKRRLQWDLPYQTGDYTVWDTGHVSTELKRLVESGTIKPCRVVEMGCGTGNDAVYLASQGFDVTAIDIAPTALDIAEKNAEKAGVRVRWLLADVLQPPSLEPFDLVYDRGCYHEVRQHHAKDYVVAVKKLTHVGAKVVILAGNANKDTYWRFEGPPRVKEQDIRHDFADGFRLLQLREFRFDAAPSQKQGALAWSILLERGE